MLSFDAAKTHVAFSKLHSDGALILFGRTRPKLYRLLDPRSLCLAWSGAVGGGEFAQEEYRQLVFDVLRAVRQRMRLVSFCVYGSVARGEAKPTSDLDILLISDDLRGSIASRLDLLSFVDIETFDEVRFLRGNGRSTAVSLIPLTRKEAGADPALFLDLAVHAKILLDEGGFLNDILAKLRGRLALAGAKRIETANGWYWDLKPGFVPGQEVVI